MNHMLEIRFPQHVSQKFFVFQKKNMDTKQKQYAHFWAINKSNSPFPKQAKPYESSWPTAADDIVEEVCFGYNVKFSF